ncbi:DNA primase [Patescibacteria group bacterium]|nr:DNA primase [Patescibacteria group bacterium]
MFLSPIEEIKNRLDIVKVISSYIKLKKAGANYKALCPFHSEKKPSFFVSPARQIWHCFGCSAGGDIFKFVMQIEGVEFGDALKILARRAGVKLKREDPKLRTERQRTYEICELSSRFFQKQLEGSKTGLEAKKYLLARGITEESIKKWQIGYAPDSWRGLSDFLVSQGYTREEVEKAGLAIKNEKGNFYDRFRGRIIFPIFDLNSQPIGFGGRVFKTSREPRVIRSRASDTLKEEGGREQDDRRKGETLVSPSEPAKYINTPGTLLYDKSRILYGLDKAKMEIRKRDFSILVEGYIDVIMSHQVGFNNVVATSGTALTPYQLKILKRYSENILTAFDMDIAGDWATKRGIDLAQAQGFNVKIITMPESLDPADIISQNQKKWKELVESSKSILDFYFETTFSKFDRKTPQGKKGISKILLKVIKRIPNKIEQSYWIQQLSKNLEVREEDVIAELRKIKIEKPETEEVEELPPQKSRKERLEERLVTLILKSPEHFSLISEKDFDFFSSSISKTLSYLKKEIHHLAKLKPPSELADLINYFLLKSEIEEISGQDLDKEFRICLKEIKTLEIKNRLNRISREIKKAENEKDLSKVQKLVKEFDLCSKSLRNL